MNCFNHPDQPALGVCKSCGKGLCRNCLTELPNGLACKGRCEDRVNFLNRLVDNNKQVLATANAHIRSQALALIVLGVVFCGFGFIPMLISGRKNLLFLVVVGLVFLIMGLLRLRPKAKYPDVK